MRYINLSVLTININIKYNRMYSKPIYGIKFGISKK